MAISPPYYMGRLSNQDHKNRYPVKIGYFCFNKARMIWPIPNVTTRPDNSIRDLFYTMAEIFYILDRYNYLFSTIAAP